MSQISESDKELEKRHERLSFLYNKLKTELEELQTQGLALKKDISQVVDQEKMSAILNKLKSNQ